MTTLSSSQIVYIAIMLGYDSKFQDTAEDVVLLGTKLSELEERVMKLEASILMHQICADFGYENAIQTFKDYYEYFVETNRNIYGYYE